ncbi:apolipoprotein N-acyltransferase [Nocardioides sp. ChNu-99]|uniref:apolipoprotein N-acyltransferase n=1 Tax=Nocardioides sp. ChNu-99 TaxID=2839897 RepID=UPI002405F65C|nr:apolipoprotein N-acyltransferase [Nocardioides sp. ChNu-99]MDF9717925.1 apolipoprotein N-acyltransferase [Nocardioides sp. ChNu-99]
MPASSRLRVLLAVLAGLVGSAAFDPVGLVLCGPLAVAGLALAVRGTRVRTALALGTLFGAAFQFALLWWMRAVGPEAWIALSLIETLYYALLGPVVMALQRVRGWPLWVAAAWVACEELRGTWPFGGFPWGRLAFGTADTPFSALLPWVGTAGTSLVLALLGTLLAAAVVALRAEGRALGRDRRRVARLVVPLGVLGAVVALAALRPYEVPTTGPVVPVAAVQGDVPGAGDDVVPVHREVTENHVRTTVELADRIAAGTSPTPAFVLWPENSTAVDPFTDRSTTAGIEEAVAAVGVPVVVGGMVDAPAEGQVLNQGIVWDDVTGPGDRYAKRHPVPFGEFIPFRNAGLASIVDDFDLIPRDMVAGTRDTPLEVAGIRVGNAICFDVAYDDGFRDQVRAGAQVLTVQTSNAMFIRTHQVDQQFEITRLRAIESGKYLVVAAINGQSAVVAPDGEVVSSIDRRTRGVVEAEVVLNDVVTPGLRLGPWIAAGVTAATALPLLGLVLAGLGGARLRRRTVDGGHDGAPAQAQAQAQAGGTTGPAGQTDQTGSAGARGTAGTTRETVG